MSAAGRRGRGLRLSARELWVERRGCTKSFGSISIVPTHVFVVIHDVQVSTPWIGGDRRE